METTLPPKMAFRIKRRFKNLVLPTFFQQASSHTRAHNPPPQSLRRGSRAKRCTYRTRLEDHDPTEDERVPDLPAHHGLNSPRYPSLFSALSAGPHPDLLEASCVISEDQRLHLENDDDDDDDDRTIPATRTSSITSLTSSWTRVDGEEIGSSRDAQMAAANAGPEAAARCCGPQSRLGGSDASSSSAWWTEAERRGPTPALGRRRLGHVREGWLAVAAAAAAAAAVSLRWGRGCEGGTAGGGGGGAGGDGLADEDWDWWWEG